MPAPWVVPAVIGGSVLLSTAMQWVMSGQATDAQLESADKAARTQLEMFYQTREDLEPWMEAGKWALEQLVGWTKYETDKPRKADYKRIGDKPKHSDYQKQVPGEEGEPKTVLDPQAHRRAVEEWESLDEQAYNRALKDWEATGVYQPGLIEQGPGEFVGSPGYEFRFGEGMKAIERGASARGGVLSGATQKALVEYGQGFATSEYDKFINRYYAKLNPLLTTAGMAPLGTVGQTGAQVGGNLANIALGAGQSRAGGYINRANIYGNLGQQGTNLAAQYYMWDQAGMFDQGSQPGVMGYA